MSKFLNNSYEFSDYFSDSFSYYHVLTVIHSLLYTRHYLLTAVCLLLLSLLYTHCHMLTAVTHGVVPATEKKSFWKTPPDNPPEKDTVPYSHGMPDSTYLSLSQPPCPPCPYTGNSHLP